ncbi:MAG: FAD-dependent oxidoreductase [Erysipelotrichales bacterium]|nr:FAD-dependent oxidoreductase [Erysipelotrichales bacterium]
MNNLYDLIIIGGGPAGLSAAIYAGRAKLKTLVLEKSDIGGQIKITAEVVNYPGVFSTSGAALTMEMKKQAVNFGVEFVFEDVTEVDFKGDVKKLKTSSNHNYEAIAVIVATGAKPRKLGFEGEVEFAGRGIGYCATCDGEFFTDREVFVIGGGFAAAEEAIYLTRFASKVTIIVREPEFTCSKTIIDKVLSNKKIEVKYNTEIVYARGENVLKKAKFINNQTKESWVFESETTFGIFVFIGYEPISDIIRDSIETDKAGYVLGNEEMETNIAGIYVAGDLRPKRLRQLVTATSDGAIASTSAEKYIEQTKEKLGIVIENKESKQVQEDFFSDEIKNQIRYVMDRCESKVTLNAILLKDNELSTNIKAFLTDFKALTNKVSINIHYQGEKPELEAKIGVGSYPLIAIFDKDGNYSRISFSGVPGGHELESFILAIYNVAGPGQRIDEVLLQRIKLLNKKLNLKVGISLSCTMCPDVVQAVNRLSALNENISAEMIDLKYFKDLRDQHSIMSVPALIINDQEVIFGKKSLEELVALLESK